MTYREFAPHNLPPATAVEAAASAILAALESVPTPGLAQAAMKAAGSAYEARHGRWADWYAVVRWGVDDLDPYEWGNLEGIAFPEVWGEQARAAWFEEHEGQIQDAMVSTGWDVIRELLLSRYGHRD